MKIEKTATWLRPALQGVPYWIGHRKAMYPHYPLPEAAIVAELCNLIQANLPSDHKLCCEVQYSEFLIAKSSKLLGPRARVDLVVEPKENCKGQIYLFEVKRLKAGKKQIENDLERLSQVKHNNKNIRTGLIVVSEAVRPKNFVNENGVAIRSIMRTSKTKAPYKVRGVVKSASSFKSIKSAHYACFIEVLAKPRGK